MDDHQSANAAVLEKAGAAWVVMERDLDVPKLASLIERILSEPDALRARAKAARSLGRVDAAQRLADLAEQLGP
jgi:UDP-N-acetylglucosamine--N-acetylmuramyl-(pentapeptide) pyrophosphoryl-undecaprenol N-acetylglucosamine transferase